MVTDEDAALAARFQRLSEDELLAVVGKDREAYTEDAIRLAWIELRRRGIESMPAMRARPAMTEEPAQAPSRELGTKWIGVYAAIVGPLAVLGPLVQLVLGTSGAEVVAAQMPLAGLGVAVAYGVLKRRAWGWYVNWLLLVLTAGAGLLTGAGFGIIVLWCVPNGIYFARRRHLFVPGAGSSNG
jgi:hypothetical protein